MSFIAELKRRNVIRMAGLYLVGAWMTLQVADTLLPVSEAPGWVKKVLVAALAIGSIAALTVACEKGTEESNASSTPSVSFSP